MYDSRHAFKRTSKLSKRPWPNCLGVKPGVKKWSIFNSSWFPQVYVSRTTHGMTHNYVKLLFFALFRCTFMVIGYVYIIVHRTNASFVRDFLMAHFACFLCIRCEGALLTVHTIYLVQIIDDPHLPLTEAMAQECFVSFWKEQGNVVSDKSAFHELIKACWMSKTHMKDGEQ